MPVQKRSPAVWICAALALAGIVATGLWLRQLPWRADFSKWQPASMFQMVLGKPPPPGVSRICVAGRHYVIKRWVWMRFQATRPAMNFLAVLGTPISRADAQRLLHETWTANDRYDDVDRQYDDVDRQKVNWSTIDRVAHPVAYEFWTGTTSPWLWHGIMVLDSQNQTVYVRALGD